MVYSNRFVACVLADDKVVTEMNNGEIHLPFGSHYSIRLRNKHNRNACAQIIIDGEVVSGEVGYKVPANDFINIHRFANKDCCFKFVDLDSGEAIEHGKNGPNINKIKGLIEVRFFLEKEKPVTPKVEHIHHYHQYPVPYPIYPTFPKHPRWGSHYYDFNTNPVFHTCANDNSYNSGSGACSLNASNYSASIPPIDPVNSIISDQSINYDYSDESNLKDGATIESNQSSGQKFGKIYMDLEENFTSIKLFIKGFHKQKNSVDTVSNEVKSFCTNCGSKKEINHKFCGECGKKH